MVSEQLQHEPVQLSVLGTSHFGDSCIDEGLVLVDSPVVNDGVGGQGSSLGQDVFQAEGQPLIKGDDASRLLVHGVEHPSPGTLLLLHSPVEVAVLGSKPVLSGQSSGSVNQLGERFLTDQAVIVGVGINKHLQQTVVELRVAVAFLVSDGLLDKPDEVILGLVESGGWGGRHLGVH